jgi:hypothetical protein
LEEEVPVWVVVLMVLLGLLAWSYSKNPIYSKSYPPQELWVVGALVGAVVMEEFVFVMGTKGVAEGVGRIVVVVSTEVVTLEAIVPLAFERRMETDLECCTSWRTLRPPSVWPPLPLVLPSPPLLCVC